MSHREESVEHLIQYNEAQQSGSFLKKSPFGSFLVFLSACSLVQWNMTFEKVKKVCICSKWSIKPELIPVSVA